MWQLKAVLDWLRLHHLAREETPAPGEKAAAALPPPCSSGSWPSSLAPRPHRWTS